MSIILYKRQRQILDHLYKYISENGFAPTIREIGKALGISSPATVEEHLQTLERKGVIRRESGIRRAITINPEFTPKTTERIPILGQIAAGQPLEAIEDRNSFVEFSPVRPGENLFGLKVSGNSMIEDGIFDGDIVIIRGQESCIDGSVIVALLEDGSATLKRIYREKNRIRLQPANSELNPIYVDNIRIQGKVIGLVRKF